MKRIISISAILAIAGLLYLLINPSHKLESSAIEPLKADHGSKTPTADQPVNASDERRVARNAAAQLTQKSQSLLLRLKNLRQEIDQSGTPEKIFEELAGMIDQIEEPMARRALSSEIYNGMAGFDNPDECLKWMRSHDELLRKYFSNLPSGTGSSSCYINLYSVIAGRAKMKGQAEEIVDLLSKDKSIPASQSNVTMASSIVMATSDFTQLEKLDDRAQQQCLAYIFENYYFTLNPGIAARNYVGPDFQKLNDPDGSLLAKLMSNKWAQGNSDEILRIIENSDPSEKRDNLIKVASSKIAETDQAGADQLLQYLTTKDP